MVDVRLDAGWNEPATRAREDFRLDHQLDKRSEGGALKHLEILAVKTPNQVSRKVGFPPKVSENAAT
jgi:hypothetical protein